MQIVKQKAKAPWIDEAGNTIPFATIKHSEKVNEKQLYDVATAALKASAQLKKLKEFIDAAVAKVVDAFHKDYKGKRKEFKGNYTFFNFNHSIKLEVSVSNPIRFDDLLINEAKQQLDDFLNDGIDTKNITIKEMVMAAFETSRGRLDVKKIMALQRYADRIKDTRYTKAMELISAAIRRPDTATYYRVFIKNDKGQFEHIPLTLADV